MNNQNQVQFSQKEDIRLLKPESPTKVSLIALQDFVFVGGKKEVNN